MLADVSENAVSGTMVAEDHAMSPRDDTPAIARRFATTRWSLVLAAGQRGTSEADQALETLCRAYWYPLYAEARRRGLSAEDASDRVQGFFARLLESDGLAVADQQRGRFRSFLLGAFGNFLANEWDREHALKRGGGRAIVSLDLDLTESRYRADPVDEATPERIFDRRWALSLIQRALGRLQDEYGQGGKADLFDALKPVLTGDRDLKYADLARSLAMTEGALKVAVHRLRGRCGALIRDEVAQTVDAPDETEDELRHLFAALGS